MPSIRNQFHNFVVKIHDIPHLNYHKKVVEECLVSTIKLFTTPAVSQDSLVDECIVMIHGSVHCRINLKN